MTTTEKTCFKCGACKPITEFYRHPQMADGLLGKCKACTKSDVTANRKRNLDYYRKSDRERAKKPEAYARRARYRKTDKGKAATA